MKILLALLVAYCVFAYGYGLAMLVDVFKEALDETSDYYRPNRPVFLAGTLFILIWVAFPIAWPLLGLAVIFDDKE